MSTTPELPHPATSAPEACDEAGSFCVKTQSPPLGSWLPALEAENRAGYERAVRKKDSTTKRAQLREFLAAVADGSIAWSGQYCPHKVPLLVGEQSSAACLICSLPPDASKTDIRWAWTSVLGVLGMWSTPFPQVFDSTKAAPSEIGDLVYGGIVDVDATPGEYTELIYELPDDSEEVPEMAPIEVLYSTKLSLRQKAMLLGLSHPQQVKRLLSKVEGLAAPATEKAARTLGYSLEEWREHCLRKLLPEEQARAAKNALKREL